MKIYQHLAKAIENGLNDVVILANPQNPCLVFSVKDMYDKIEQSDKKSKIAGVVSYKSKDILPIAGLDIYIAPASVSLVCAKEWADTVVEVIEMMSQAAKGKTQTIGEYAAIPTYSTPTRSEIGLVGQLAEAMSISFDCSWVLIKNGILANQVKVSIDNKALTLTSFEFSKTRSCPSDNQENSEIVKSEAQTQSLGFNFSAILTSDFADLIDEIMTQNRLKQTHTLSVEGLTDTYYTYNALMTSGNITGQMGGAVASTMAFTIAG